MSTRPVTQKRPGKPKSQKAKRQRSSPGETPEISSGSVKRLAIIAGLGTKKESKQKHVVYRMSPKAVETTKKMIQNMVTRMMKECVIIAEHMRILRINYDVLKYVMQMHGRPLYGSADTKYKLCKSTKEVRKRESLGACLVMTKTAFRALARSAITGRHSFGKGFLDNFQHVIEMKMVDILKAAINAALEIGQRSTLMNKDMLYVEAHNCKASRGQRDASTAIMLGEKKKAKKRRNKKKSSSSSASEGKKKAKTQKKKTTPKKTPPKKTPKKPTPKKTPVKQATPKKVAKKPRAKKTASKK